MTTPTPLDQRPKLTYHALAIATKKHGVGSSESGDALLECVRGCLEFLATLDRRDLVSKVPGKEYFVFENHNPRFSDSRGINAGWFNDDIDEVIAAIQGILDGVLPDDPNDLHSALYTAAISYPAATDVTKAGDQKSPGTFFEVLVGQLVSVTLDSQPAKSVAAPTLDMVVTLPTDFVFDLGAGRSRIHLPVKTSTRERVVQVWAHQRVLDGMHGVGRFQGVLVVLAETNRKTQDDSISEVCLPGQWTAYQMYIAQMRRVYYMDIPDKYVGLKDIYPFLQVKAFAEFFYEWESLVNPAKDD